MPLLDVSNVTINFITPSKKVNVVKNVSFTLDSMEVFGLVGQSGAGKTQLINAIAGLLPSNSEVFGDIFFDSINLSKISKEDRRKLLAKKIAIIFQEHGSAINPYRTVGSQLTELIKYHFNYDSKWATQEVITMLDAVKIPMARQKIKQYPHEFSGGQLQRVMIAMALLCKPQLLIADEPTSSLDILTKNKIIDLMQELHQEFKIAMLLITHDLLVASKMCSKLAVIRQGQILELNATTNILDNPQHDYTKQLINEFVSNPVEPCQLLKSKNSSNPILEVEKLSVSYVRKQSILSLKKVTKKIIHDIDFSVDSGQCLGIIGESGSGKTTLAKALSGFLNYDSGSVLLSGRPLNFYTKKVSCHNKEMQLWRNVQLVYQNPFSSFNPYHKIMTALETPLLNYFPEFNDEKRRDKIKGWLDYVELSVDILNRYPHEISGGQCQRIAIARALLVEPKLLICDEIDSALDIATQIQIIHLLKNLKEKFNLSLLYISHNLNAIKKISDKVIVIHRGKNIENGSVYDVFKFPKMDYTKALLKS